MGRIKKGRTRRTPARMKGDDYIPEIDRTRWVEHGTLANRDPRHEFKRKRDHRSAKWRGGIRPIRATERAWAATSQRVYANIPKESRSAIERYNRKHGLT